MKRIELIIHASILVIALGLAYGAWKGDEPAQRRSFPIFDPGKQGVEEIGWEDEKTVATIAVPKEGGAWITHGRRKLLPTPKDAPPAPPTTGPASADPPDAGTAQPDAGPSPPASEPATASKADVADKVPPEYGPPQLRSFPGNDASTQLIESLAPMKALRQFDDLDEETLEAMGMVTPTGRLEIKTRTGKVVEFEVGANAYGSKSTYVRIVGKPTIYLLSEDIVSMVRSADSRLMERRLWRFDTPNALHLDVAPTGGEPTRLIHKSRLSKSGSFWTRSGSDARATEVDGFVEKLFDLRAQTYPARDDEPKDTDLEQVFSVQIEVEGSRPQTVEIARASGEPGKEKWYARTALTRGWIAIRPTLAADMAELLPKLPPAE